MPPSVSFTPPRERRDLRRALLLTLAAVLAVAFVGGGWRVWHNRPRGRFQAWARGAVNYTWTPGTAVTCTHPGVDGTTGFDVFLGPEDYEHGFWIGTTKEPRTGATWTLSQLIKDPADAGVGVASFRREGRDYAFADAHGWVELRRVTADSVSGHGIVYAEVFAAAPPGAKQARTGIDTVDFEFEAVRDACREHHG